MVDDEARRRQVGHPEPVLRRARRHDRRAHRHRQRHGRRRSQHPRRAHGRRHHRLRLGVGWRSKRDRRHHVLRRAGHVPRHHAAGRCAHTAAGHRLRRPSATPKRSSPTGSPRASRAAPPRWCSVRRTSPRTSSTAIRRRAAVRGRAPWRASTAASATCKPPRWCSAQLARREVLQQLPGQHRRDDARGEDGTLDRHERPPHTRQRRTPATVSDTHLQVKETATFVSGDYKFRRYVCIPNPAPSLSKGPGALGGPAGRRHQNAGDAAVTSALEGWVFPAHGTCLVCCRAGP